MERVLVVDPPEEIVFVGPLSERQSVTVSLTNTCQYRRMVFKMKTTAPASYRVRPTGGFIVPGATQNIEIALKKEEYPEPEQKLHRFMIVYTFPPPEVEELSNDFWKTVPSQEMKKYIIPVKYEQPPALE